MTHEQQRRIIDILSQHGQLIGVSDSEVNDLINAVKFIKCRSINPTVDEQVVNELHELCRMVHYTPNKKNNKDRHIEMVAKRDAVAKVIFDRYEIYGHPVHVLVDFFGKDRTSILAQGKRVNNRLETKDPIFMRYYSELINFEKQAA